MLYNTPSESRAGKSKVFLVDDHPIVRQGLALLINREPDMTVCGEADGAPCALQLIPAVLPDVVVLDISLDGPDGLDLLKAIRLKDPVLPVLVLSMHDESSYAERWCFCRQPRLESWHRQNHLPRKDAHVSSASRQGSCARWRPRDRK